MQSVGNLSRSNKPEITISIQRGDITFSFKTNDDGSGLEDGVTAVERLISKHGRRLSKIPTRAEEAGSQRPVIPSPQILLSDLRIPSDVRSALTAHIRNVGYWDLVLLLLSFASRALTYDDIMTVSSELRKPVSYKWLNTEFHRKQYSGLVRSEPIPGSKEKRYSLNEPGRRRVEGFISRLKKKEDGC